jgi:hypothetical protein
MFKNCLREIVTQNFMPPITDDDLDSNAFREKYAVKKNVISKLQHLWKDEKEAALLIAQISK